MSNFANRNEGAGIERNWNNRYNRLAQLGYLITKIILIIPISFKKTPRISFKFTEKLCKVIYIINRLTN